MTSSVRVSSPVIGPWIAHTLFPATGEPIWMNSESGHEPVKRFPPEPPEPPVPPDGGSRGPSSPGDAIEVLPPPQATSKKIDKKSNEFLIDLVNINYSPPRKICSYLNLSLKSL
jgi:hypothetical protein